MQTKKNKLKKEKKEVKEVCTGGERVRFRCGCLLQQIISTQVILG